MLITAFDAYLTPRSPRAWYQVWAPKTQPGTYWDLNQDPSDSERSALTHLSMTLAHKYVNLRTGYH